MSELIAGIHARNHPTPVARSFAYTFAGYARRTVPQTSRLARRIVFALRSRWPESPAANARAFANAWPGWRHAPGRTLTCLGETHSGLAEAFPSRYAKASCH